MAPIIAICPYCRIGGVRAPGTAVGASATCPKCKSNFTLAPEENLPDWARAGAVTPAPVPDETRAAAALPDVTEPSPVLPTTAPAAAAPPAPPPADFARVLALGALALVGPAALASQLPFGRVIALGLTALGVVGGLLCVGAEGRARAAGVLAAVSHGLLLVVVALLPSWLNLEPWARPDEPAQPTPVRIEHASGVPAGAASGWIDAEKFAWQFGDLRVSARASVGPLRLAGPRGAKRTTKEVYLALTVRVTNVGFERELALSGWAAGGHSDAAVRVADADGREFKRAEFEPGWAPAGDPVPPADRLRPAGSAEVKLLYAVPPRATAARVELPGAAVGAPEGIRFQLPCPAPGGQPKPSRP